MTQQRINFHNTIDLEGQELNDAINTTNNQRNLIHAYFKKYKDFELTPCEVHAKLFDESTPITSIRRAITNLTKSGYLVKTSKQRRGKYGKMNYLWRLA